MRRFACHELSEPLCPEVSDRLGLSFRSQEQAANLRYVQLSLTAVLSDEKVLIAVDAVGAGPALRNTYDEHKTSVNVDGLNLDARKPWLNTVHQHILEPAGFLIRIPFLRHDPRSTAFAVLVQTVDEITSRAVGECGNIRQELVPSACIATGQISLQIQICPLGCLFINEGAYVGFGCG